MSETGMALRATSDALLAELEALEALEREKRDLDPGHPRLPNLAAGVEEIARRLLGTTVRQRELTVAAQKMVAAGDLAAPDASIERTTRAIHLILADWRDAERRAAHAEPDTAEAAEAMAQVDQLREEYRQAHDAARRGG